MSDREWFPISNGPDIPWSLIAPFEKLVIRQHGQTLERLAQRGGLSVCEVLSILEGNGDFDKFWQGEDVSPHISRLRELVSSHQARSQERVVDLQAENAALRAERDEARMRNVELRVLWAKDTLRTKAAESRLAALEEALTALETNSKHHERRALNGAGCELWMGSALIKEQEHMCGLSGYGALGDTCPACHGPFTYRAPRCTCDFGKTLAALRARLKRAPD